MKKSLNELPEYFDKIDIPLSVKEVFIHLHIDDYKHYQG